MVAVRTVIDPRPDVGAQLLLSLAAMAAILVVLGLFLLLRRHPPFRANARLDLIDIAMIGLVPSVVAAVVHGRLFADPFSVLGVAGLVAGLHGRGV